jgi:hypothetical protein
MEGVVACIIAIAGWYLIYPSANYGFRLSNSEQISAKGPTAPKQVVFPSITSTVSYHTLFGMIMKFTTTTTPADCTNGF